MEASKPAKRRLVSANDDSAHKKRKPQATKKWRPRNEHLGLATSPSGIEPGVSGIWVTCERGREAGCVPQLYELFNEYATKIHGEDVNADPSRDGQTPAGIEAVIESELQNLRQPDKDPLFRSIRVDMKCVLFFPDSTAGGAHLPHPPNLCRCAEFEALVTQMGRATENGLDEVAEAVLAPYFHETGSTPTTVGPTEPTWKTILRFAIRTTFRNHNSLKRDDVIKRVAEAVGRQHQVDLDRPKLQILVEISQNVCGMAVVDESYAELKRYNLAELYS